MIKSRFYMCLFKSVVRIPNDFTTRSNFIHEYRLIFGDTPSSVNKTRFMNGNCKKIDINILFESIINTNIGSYSPYDSALFFHSLILAYESGQKVDINDVLYKRARDLLLRDMAKYRIELFPYFFDRLTLVRDTVGISTYLSCLDIRSIDVINSSILCDIIIKLAKTYKRSKSTSVENVLNSEFFKCIICKLSNSSSQITNSPELLNQFNSQNIFKLIYGLAKLGYITDNSNKILSNLIPLVNGHLDDCSWDAKTILKLGWAYHIFDLIDKKMFNKISNVLFQNLDDFDCKEIGIIQDIYTRDKIWNDTLLTLTKSRLKTFLNYGEDEIVSIPPEFIVSLARTHGFIQYGKVDLQLVAAKIIADTVEFRLKQIIQEASKFMYRNGRTINHMAMTTDDIRCALKSLKMQDPPGYSDLCNHRYVCADKLYMGNRVIKRESKLIFNRDNWGRCKLSDIVFSPMENVVTPLPKLSVQWLSVKGTFPLISSNFGVDVTESLSRRAEDLYNMLKNSTKISQKTGEIATKNGFPSRNNEIISRLSNAFADSMSRPVSRDSTSKPVTSIPRVEHVLEKEHHFFLNCVKNAVTRSIDLGVIHSSQYKQLAKVLHILSTSLALDQLMPELCYFFSTQINIHMKNSLPHAISIMLSFAYAIISNPYAHVHFHIHQLLIPILQVAIGKYDFPSILIYQVLRLRKKAANLVGRIVFILRGSRNGLEYIDSQIIILLKQALSGDEMSIFTLYGAIACLSNMSPISRALLLYPNFNSILSTLIYLSIKTRHLLDTNNSDSQGDNIQLVQIKNIIYNETLQLLLGTIYYSLECDFLNMPDLFFSSSNSGYSPPYYQPNTNQLLEMLNTFKLFMNGLMYDMFTPLLLAILRKVTHFFKTNKDHRVNGFIDLPNGHLIDLTL